MSADEVGKLLEEAFQRGFISQGSKSHPRLSDQVVQNYLDQLQDKDITITQLEEKLEAQGKKIAELLNDKDISPELKALIEVGDFDAAETLVDKHYDQQVKDDDMLN